MYCSQFQAQCGKNLKEFISIPIIVIIDRLVDTHESIYCIFSILLKYYNPQIAKEYYH